jgi:hypothetical protein
MQNEEIADRIRYILEPAPTSARFYKRKKTIGHDVTEAEFDNEHVDLLLQIESKINIQSGKDFFWRLVGHSFIIPQTKDSSHKNWLPPGFSRTEDLVEQLCDYAFMAYVRANRTDEAFHGVIANLKDYTSINETNYKILHCIYQILLYEQDRLSEQNLISLETMINKYTLYIIQAWTLRKNMEEDATRLLLESPVMRLARLHGTFPQSQSSRKSQVMPKADLIGNLDDLISKLKSALKRARFERVRDELRGISSGINQDKNSLITKYKGLGFSPELTEALESIDIETEKPGSKFSYSGSISFVRNILERSLREIALVINNRTGKNIPQKTEKLKMGQSISYFRSIDFISAEEEKMLTGFSGFISDTGPHSLTSERYEVRIAKNILIEVLSYLTDKMDSYMSKFAKS